MRGAAFREGTGFARWMVFCAYCSFIGWILSWAKALHATGYVVALGTGLGAAAWLARTAPATGAKIGRRGRLRKRFSRGFPLAFSGLAALAIMGGILYAPTNFDALVSRTPRVLHWLAEQQWHWIHTEFGR